MPYLNLDTDYFEHPKTVRLVGLLGRGAEVLPPKLWAHCARFYRNGRLTAIAAKEIETWVGWWGKPGECIQAMLDCGKHVGKSGFLDPLDGGGFEIHGWEEHGGHIQALHERAKKGAAARWSKLKGDPFDANTIHQASKNDASKVPKQCPSRTSLPSVPKSTEEKANGKTEFSEQDDSPGFRLNGESPDSPKPNEESPLTEVTQSEGEKLPGWQCWVRAWDGKPPSPRYIEQPGALSKLEKYHRDANVQPKLESAMREFRANNQVKIKTVEHFLDPKMFGPHLARAKAKAPAQKSGLMIEAERVQAEQDGLRLLLNSMEPVAERTAEQFFLELKAKMQPGAFKQWFGASAVAGWDKNLILTVTNRYCKNWIESYYAKEILAAAQEVNPNTERVGVLVRGK